MPLWFSTRRNDSRSLEQRGIDAMKERRADRRRARRQRAKEAR